MATETSTSDIFGFMKPLVDVHTMGIFTMANLLRDCGYKVFIAPDDVSQAIEDIHKLNNYSLVKGGYSKIRLTELDSAIGLTPRKDVIILCRFMST